jgi:hypothetical protein
MRVASRRVTRKWLRLGPSPQRYLWKRVFVPVRPGPEPGKYPVPLWPTGAQRYCARRGTTPRRAMVPDDSSTVAAYPCR